MRDWFETCGCSLRCFRHVYEAFRPVLKLILSKMGSIGVFILLTLFIETGSVPRGFEAQVGTKSRNCTYKGIEYPPGSFKTHDCKECVCAGDGEMECTETKCFDYPCVDKVRRPGDCCPMCPNGKRPMFQHILYLPVIGFSFDILHS